MQCSGCGKYMPDNPCDDRNAEGLEGYIANNLPLPAKGWCSAPCYDLDNISTTKPQ